ncbi:hypothetical protein QCB45_06980 [Thiomicrorhabdus sp. ZW0627]|uniref:hypothetical protein n=1 Tax=Thiomicrorhabdus sp. ZW0627 TaxID=3039774 RepID=UPI0024371CB0|nr:hypothetical protein [Thiomicrorhabdus sp. ZW0627]MDG6774070.1 hypothetical protein [Thiomicrorhabdus sp. ZW0627]
MANPKFSAGLFEEMGGTIWVARPDYFENQTDIKQSPASLDVETVEHCDTASTIIAPDEVQAEPSCVAEVSFTPEGQSAQGQTLNGLVLIGSGLNSIWEDENRLEWQLWLNICEALGWPEDQVAYYDTDALISEEMLFSTIEEIVESGVERVLSMQPYSELSEQLSEGLQVIEVPSLQDMLFDPYAKQSFYQSVMVVRNQV